MRARRDGVCMSCRGRARRKYVFTEEISEELRGVYAGKKKQQITTGLDLLQRKTGWPRQAFTREAIRRGLVTRHWRPWEEWEVELVEGALGELNNIVVFKRLRRSPESVFSKASELKISRRRTRGYNLAELGTVFGVGYYRVSRWVARGLMGKAHHRYREVWVTDANVVAFLKNYPAEYDLRRVDQIWFKSVIFGATAGRA